MPYKEINNFCIDCGKRLSTYKAQRCRKCNGLAKRKYKDMDVGEYRRNWHLKKKYGLEMGEFDAYWQACRGLCWICGKKMKMPTKSKGQDLDVVAVDHDHKTGKVRGLLCNGCNKALGFFNDDIDIIKKALKYLKGNNE